MQASYRVSAPRVEHSFRVGEALKTASAGDLGLANAGTRIDAGTPLLGNTIPAPGVCFSGHLTPTSDITDAFSFQAHAGDTVSYSIGATADRVLLSVTNGVGRSLGPMVGSGQVGIATLLPTADTPIGYIIDRRAT